jgi:hypothetical protein
MGSLKKASYRFAISFSRSVIGCGAGLLTAACGTAWAYIPPSSFLVKSLVAKRAGNKGFYVKSRVRALASEQDPGFIQVSFYDSQARVLKLRGLDAEGRELYSVDRRVDGGGEQGAGAPPLAALLMEKNPVELVRILKSSGIPIRTESELLALKTEEERRASELTVLRRLKPQVAWVIGLREFSKAGRSFGTSSREVAEKEAADKEGAADARAPQLWLEKDTYLPLKLVYASDQGAFEALFESPRFQGAVSYPGSITISRFDRKSGPAKPVFREELLEWNLGGEPAELRGGGAGGLTAIGAEAPDELRELLLNYYTWVR